MKKRYKQLMSVIALFSLLVVMLPTQSIAAQEDTEKTVGYFDELLTEETSESEALLQAYEDYKKVFETYHLQDVALEDVTGSTFEEVESFEAAVEPEYLELSEDEAYLSYVYESDSWHTEGEKTQAELILYFVDGVLYYAGVAAIEMNVTEAEVVADADIQGWVDERVPFSTIVERAPRVVGVSNMLFDGADYYQVLIPTGDSLEELLGDYVLVTDDTVLNSFPIEISEALDQPQSQMIGLYAEYFFPTEEETSDEAPTTEETTEETTEAEEGSETDESTDAESEPAGQVSTNPLGEIVTEESVHNEALMTAFGEYQKLVDQFELQDPLSDEVTGSTSQDVIDNFETDVEHNQVEMSETEFYISYIYSSDETSPTTGEAKQAELLLYFVDDILYYVGTATLDMELYNEDLSEEEEVARWVEEEVDIQTVIDYQPHVMGVSQMIIGGNDYYQLFMPVGTVATEDLNSDFVVIENDKVLDAYRMPMTDAIESPQTEMLSVYFSLSDWLSGE